MSNDETTSKRSLSNSINHSADYNDLVIQPTQLKFDQRAFSVAGPRTWNQVPTGLKTTINTAQFKRKLKTYLFFAFYLQLHYFIVV